MNKEGFTLAEVLITLGIIGVVAAITLPTLIAKHQKQVFYTQFRKAASQLENALKMYEIDNGCEGNISNCFTNENYSIPVFDIKFTNKFSKYFKISNEINENNYNEICKNYDTKLGYATRETLEYNNCRPEFDFQGNLTGFITTDGVLYFLASDDGAAGGYLMDINGPIKGPNTRGRDVYLFYLRTNKGLVWGGNESKAFEDFHPDGNIECTENNGDGCAAKLLQEGKMNY